MSKRLLKLLGAIGLTVVIAIPFAAGCAAPEEAPTPATAPAPTITVTAPATTVTAPATTEEVFEWKSQQIHSAGSVWYELGTNLFKDIEKMSGGRLVITNHPPGALVPFMQELDATQRGTIDVMMVPAAFYKGILGESVNFFGGSYPGGPGPSEAVIWYLEGGGRALYKEMIANAGYDKVEHIGYWGMSSAEGFAWSNKPLDSLAAFKGVKFRSMGMWAAVLDKLGAAVVSVPGGELYSAMERGVIDAFEFTTPGNDVTMGFTEIATYWHGPGIQASTAGAELNFNKDKWDELPADLQEIVRKAVDASLFKSWAKMDVLDMEAIAFIQAEGLEIIVLSQEMQDEIILVTAELMDVMANEDPFFKKVLTSHRDFLKDYRNLKSLVQP